MSRNSVLFVQTETVVCVVVWRSIRDRRSSQTVHRDSDTLLANRGHHLPDIVCTSP